MKLHIEKAIYGGAGLAREEGKAIFVPFSLPGESVEAHLVQNKSSFAEAALDAVLTPSPFRTEARCPYFGICGGCSYQHASYAEQLTIKASILRETLQRARLENVPEIVTHYGEPYGYRNRIRLHLERNSSALAYKQRSSHREIAVTSCPIAAPVLEQALRALTAVCIAQQAGALFEEAELFTNHDASEMLLSLWLRTSLTPEESRAVPAKLEALCEALKKDVPALSGAGVIVAEPAETKPAKRGRQGQNVKRTSDSIGNDEGMEAGSLRATWGTPSLTYHAGAHDYKVSLGAFFQVNRSLSQQLVTLAVADQSGALAWDLYAGVGLFSRVLTERFDQVVAVEAAPVSSRDLRVNLASAPGAKTTAITSSTLDFLRSQAGTLAAAAYQQKSRGTALGNAPVKLSRNLPDFILVDPPRAGLGPEVTALLGRIRAARITYVSCDPSTLARDLAALVESGYQIQYMHLVDMFPQTFHLEAVAVLTLG